MKKTTKRIAMLMAIVLVAGLLVTAAAENKIFTSPVFSIPKERLEEDVLKQYMEKAEQPEEPETDGGEAEPEPAEEEEPEPELTEDGKVKRQVRISSSRKDVVIENEIITLSSKLIGFDDVEVQYQWQVDRGDGAGWVDVEGATGPNHSFVARKDTILFSWRLIVTADD